MACQVNVNSSGLDARFVGNQGNATGWTLEPTSGQATPERAVAAEWSSDGEGVAVPGDWRLMSPMQQLEPDQLYRLDIIAQTSVPALWGAKFFHPNGQMCYSDHYSSLDASAAAVAQTFYIRQRAHAATMQLWLHPTGKDASDLKVHAVSLSHAEPEPVIRWADAVYAGLPPVSEAVSTGASQQTPRTLAAMNAGEPVRLVMVGDSIVNDTSNAHFHLLLERAFPGTRVQVIEAVRNGGNAANFADQAEVDASILRPQPDLVLIGGISHRNNIDAIRSLVEKIKAGSDAEILLATGPAGDEGHPNHKSAWEPVPEPGSDDYRLRLLALAQEQGAGYLDLQTPWRLYVRRVNEPYEHFMRDPVHLNARGRQVVARLMLQYFTQ